MNPHQSQGASKILVIIFWNFTIFQYSSHSPQSKPNSISSIAKLVYELPPELPNDLRLRILGNQEILEKSQIWVETKPSAQSLFKKFVFGKTNKESHKNGYQTLLFLSNITGILYSVPNILPGIPVYLGSRTQLTQLK